MRLVVTSTAASWLVGAVIIVAYGHTLKWTEDTARLDGVALIHRLLDATPPAQRRAALEDLQTHTRVPLDLAPIAQARAALGAGDLAPGTMRVHRVSPRETWCYVALSDRETALIAGPVNPTKPPGFIPIGILLAVFAMPVLASAIALRVDRQMAKVEDASRALASGELDARVEGGGAPSSELAETFNTMAERVSALIQSRDQLIQAIPHELGTPLSRLRFHVAHLEDNLASSAEEAPLDAIAQDLDALEDLVSELLTYTQSDESPLHPERFNAKKILEDLIELAGLDMEEGREVEVVLVWEGESDAAYADPRSFQRAVENVLRNATRYARSRIEVVWACDPDEGAIVTVHDDGPGIPEALREEVLTPFFRADPHRHRSTGGVGLGLAIVHRIVQRHHGAVSISTSSHLQGAAVALSWPPPPDAIGAR